jgi:flagellar hook-length control protein FliK
VDLQNKIAVILQPGPQTDQNFHDQKKHNINEGNFQDIFKEATHQIKQTEQNQNNQQQMNSKPNQTHDKQPESKIKTESSKNVATEESVSFESKLTTEQNPANQRPNNSIDNSTSPATSKKLIIEKLHSIGLDEKTIQAFISKLNSTSIQLLEKLQSFELDKQTIQKLISNLDSENFETDTKTLSSLQDSDIGLLKIGTNQLSLADLPNETKPTPNLVSLKINEGEITSSTLVSKGNVSENAIRQLGQTSSEAKIFQDNLLKLSEMKAEENLNSTGEAENSKKTSLKLSNMKTTAKSNLAINPQNHTIKEAGQIDMNASRETEFKITSKQFQKKAIKNSKLEIANGKLVRKESLKGTQVRIQDPGPQTLKTNPTQQHQGVEPRIQAAGLNFQNSQDSFTQFHQSLTKTLVDAMPQSTAPLTDNFASTLRELELNRPVLTKGVSERSIADQIFQKFSIRGNGQNNEIKMRLEPPSLGTVRMNITTQGEIVKTSIFAESHVVKQVIESNLSQLKDAFADQGLKVDSFEVLVGGEPGFKNQKQPQQYSGQHIKGLETEDALIPEEPEYFGMQGAFSRNTGGLSVII